MHSTVLVVEDEPSVLMFLEDGLEDRGFAVVSARSGGEALSILGSGFPEISVLVADIRIGDGIDGWEIARCAREITPGLPIVYVTGDSAGAWEDQGVTASVLLQKPFTRFELADAIGSVLDRSYAA